MRCRLLILIAVLAIPLSLIAGPAVQAASAQGVSTAASSTPCSFEPATTCQSTDPTVTQNVHYYGDQSGCTYVWDVSWGDGQSKPNLTNTDPPDGYMFLANHTYAAARTYAISLTGQVTAGDCTASTFTAQFTLLSPAPPAPSPRIYWSTTSGRSGTGVTLTGNGWVPGGIIDIQQQEKNVLLGITPWYVGSDGTWKESFTVQDAPPGTYNLSFSETSGHLKVTGSFRVVDPASLTSRFIKWLNACVDGDLSVNAASCQQEAYDLASLGIHPENALSCADDLNSRLGLLDCIYRLGAQVGYGIYLIWHLWSTHHKPGP